MPGVTAELQFDVVGIGNALVDVLAHHGDDFLERYGMTKSKMELIDADRAEELYGALGSSLEMSGGSAANTIAGVASFGGKAAFLRQMDHLAGQCRANPPIDPGRPVRLPGERGLQRRAEQSAVAVIVRATRLARRSSPPRPTEVPTER